PSRSAPKWGSMRRASGRKKGSRGNGRTGSSWTRRRSRRSTRCGRSWGLNFDGGGGRWRAVEDGGGAPREGQTLAGEGLLMRYVNFVKLPHTIFALPFALLGLLVASRQQAITWRMLGLVVLAFTCARFVALGFNRIADRELDARNPRTRARELPSGRLTLRQAWVAVVVAAVAFLGMAWALNALRLALAPFGLLFVSAYSYAMRLTRWSHVWLGLARWVVTPGGYRGGTHRLGAPARDPGRSLAPERRVLRRQRPGQCCGVPRRPPRSARIMRPGSSSSGAL